MLVPDFSPDNPKEQWKRFSKLIWFHEELEMWLDISRMKISSSELNSLEPKIMQAFEAMDNLEKGSTANIDEARQVGHYWLRTPELAPQKIIANNIIELNNSIDDFSRKILQGDIVSEKNDNFTDVIWVGIGGSSLGPMLLVRTLKKCNNGLEFHFIDNIDPKGINDTLLKIGSRLDTTLIVTVSKSGGTPEPRIVMEQLKRYIIEQGLDWSKKAIAITMKDSKLYNVANSEGWLKIFEVYDWVGGRTSITSSVGLLAGALIGCDIYKFLQGASLMDQATRVKNIGENPSALLALSWYISGDGKGYRDMVVLPYKDRLELFSKYLQQLIMESLGKKLDRNNNIVNQGLAVYGNKGSTDQHAYVQQLRDGLDNFFVTFIEVINEPLDKVSINGEKPGDFLSGFLQGTRSALTEAGRQSLMISINNLNEQSLGALVALYERAVGFYGELVNINAYHQPGVEAGKIAAAKIISQQNKITKILDDGITRSIAEISKEIDFDDIETIFIILRHLVANKDNYKMEGKWINPESILFSKK